jgi:hypothetical protein
LYLSLTAHMRTRLTSLHVLSRSLSCNYTVPTMSTEKEAATYQYCKNAYACFTIPNKPRKYIYGQLLHNITWLAAEDCGSFIMEDMTVRTVDIKTVDAAIERTKVRKGPPSEYVEGLRKGKENIRWARAELRKKDAAGNAPNPNDEELLFALMNGCMKAFREHKSLKKVPSRVERAKPTLPKSCFPLPSKKSKSKTKVASRSGSGADLHILKDPTDCGWVQGLFKKYNPRDLAPYVIRWQTKPPVESPVTAATIKNLHDNYFFAFRMRSSGASLGESFYGSPGRLAQCRTCAT